MGDNSMDVDELFKKVKNKPSSGRYHVDKQKVYDFIEKLNEYFSMQNKNDVEPAVFKIKDLRDYFSYNGKMRLSVVVEKMIKDSGYQIKQMGDELIFTPKLKPEQKPQNRGGKHGKSLHR